VATENPDSQGGSGTTGVTGTANAGGTSGSGMQGATGAAPPGGTGGMGTTGGTIPGESPAGPGSTGSTGGYGVGPTGPTGPGPTPITIAPGPTGAGGPTGVGQYPPGAQVALTPLASWDAQPAAAGLNAGYDAFRQTFQKTLPSQRAQLEILAHRGIGG
jgi:hypothetical protein